MSDERRARAEARRSRAVIHRSRLQPNEADPDPVEGAAAVSLVHQLTRESWSWSGLDEPAYTRSGTPYRFVPRAGR